MAKVSKIAIATMPNDSDMLVLALATLGGTLDTGSFLFKLHHARWTKQVYQ